MSLPIFYQLTVLNTQDPLMLGRIRARRITENYNDIIKGTIGPNEVPEKDLWTERDPFVFSPLLPYFVYSTPAKEELCLGVYLNPESNFTNQYYVQSTFYSPTATKFQYFEGGDKSMGTGVQISPPNPLKNTDGTYTDKEIHKGVFPEPGDNALLGRGNADVVVKENEVLVRAGKYKNPTLQPNVPPTANQQRGFLQLSKFTSVKEYVGDTTLFELITETVLTKYLIEYNIVNPENKQNKFSGSVYLYQLKPDISINSESISINSQIDENLKTLVVFEDFGGLSMTDTIEFINKFIKTCNNRNKLQNGKVLFTTDNKFPICYRPSEIFTYNLFNSNGIVQENLSKIFQGIKLFPAANGGYGYIFTKGKLGVPTNPKKTDIKDIKYVSKPGVYGALGADKLFLLSHVSAIPGKGKINFDDTLYGISPDKFSDEIMPKTSSLVRGEELLELINLIVRFLITHTHAYPGLPPIPITQDGTSSSDILTEMQNASNKILNTYIRLN